MDLSTIVDTHSVELLTSALGLIFTVLYSFVKPSDWTPQLKRNVSIVIAAGLGIYVAYTNGLTNPTDFMGYATLTVGVSQVAYKLVLTKLGIEDKIVAVREATVDLGAQLDDPWARGVQAVLRAVDKGDLTPDQGKQAIDALTSTTSKKDHGAPPIQ